MLDPQIAAAQDADFDLVQEAASKMRPQGELSRLRRDIIAFWSTLYGHASLTTKGMLDRSVIDNQPEVTMSLVSQAIAALGADGA